MLVILLSVFCSATLQFNQNLTIFFFFLSSSFSLNNHHTLFLSLLLLNPPSLSLSSYSLCLVCCCIVFFPSNSNCSFTLIPFLILILFLNHFLPSPIHSYSVFFPFFRWNHRRIVPLKSLFTFVHSLLMNVNKVALNVFLWTLESLRYYSLLLLLHLFFFLFSKYFITKILLWLLLLFLSFS